jgi:sugar/nucleoside kinase (ribokinase family)
VQPGVAAIGLCSWDRFIVTDAYPGPGEYAIVRGQLEQAGGTTGNTCAALATLGVPTMFASYVGDDAAGAALIASLRDAGCDVRHVRQRPGGRSDTGIIVVSGSGAQRDRTIYWIQGEKPVMGDWLPIDELLDHEWLLVDINDARLRAFLLDLPAHRSPRTRLIGTMTYLGEEPEGGWEHALRHDYVFGNERELRSLTGAATFEEAVERAQQDMVARACRALYISRGGRGALAIRPGGTTEVAAFPIDVQDTTGAGDAFAAGCLWGLTERLSDAEILARGNAVGGLACRALGARAALPTRAEALALLASRDGMG